MASPRCLLALALVAMAACGAMAGDRTLGTVASQCKDQFSTIMEENYAKDSKCADAIKAAMSAAPKDVGECPGGGRADVGSEVHKCMTKTAASKDAWVTFIKGCEILNVNERTGAGEAEAAADAKPSCFPRFNSLTSFKDYLGGKQPSGGAASGAGAARGAAAGALLLAAAAAAGAALVL